MEMLLGGARARRSDVLLILPEQCGAWAAECITQPQTRDRVAVVTWIDVTRALRSVMGKDLEPMQWRIWAHAYCGAVEQDLLQMRHGPDPEAWSRSMTLRRLERATKLMAQYGGTDGR